MGNIKSKIRSNDHSKDHSKDDIDISLIPLLETVVNDKVVFMLYDTGSSVTMMDKTIFKTVFEGKAMNIMPAFEQVSGFNSGSATITEQCEIEFFIDGVQLSFPFLLTDIDSAFDCVLGMDFIQNKKLGYCPLRRMFYWVPKMNNPFEPDYVEPSIDAINNRFYLPTKFFDGNS